MATYERIKEGIFIERPNRFIAHGLVEGNPEVIHVKNTGRCKELLVSQATIYLQHNADPKRKTSWDLIAVKKGERLINMDAQIPNKVVGEWLEKEILFKQINFIKPETKYKSSRFDFYVEADDKKILIEVKGVTLEKNGVAMFPDAPTLRGVRHLEELIAATKEGYEAYVIFVIQMKGVRYFTSNKDMDPVFAKALQKAQAAGVHILALDCQVTQESIVADEEVPVVLREPLPKEAVFPLTDWYRANQRELPPTIDM